MPLFLCDFTLMTLLKVFFVKLSAWSIFSQYPESKDFYAHTHPFTLAAKEIISRILDDNCSTIKMVVSKQIF